MVLRTTVRSRIRVYWPVQPATFAEVVAGNVSVFRESPDVRPLRDVLASFSEVGDFGDYKTVTEVSIGFEGFTVGSGAQPTLGSAGERTISPTLAVTTHVDDALGSARLTEILERIVEVHPWEVPVIEVTEGVTLVSRGKGTSALASSGASSSDAWSQLSAALEGRVYTDLTHAFHAGQPHFPAFPDEEREELFSLERGDGFTAHRYSLIGQWGTHVDPPSHFAAGGRAVDELPVSEMILPLVVLDISERAASDADATPVLRDVERWEAEHGRIPARAFVALRTDWSHRWPDAAAMANTDSDGVSHTPGWSREVLTFLIEERDIAGVGHEQTDTDPGVATSAGDFSLERFLLERDRWQVELLASLDRVPAAGAAVVATWPKPQGGSGFPARVFAIH
ncbi:hypothetical protein F8O03_01415 [Pseudoclavibacter terrae]|uniref:Cyclase family protein n=1 Tax=Pseudoclavibacter terrae TaxID=1530195 RepID=A0A7J5B4E1_9MICO|nr:hypothetical protein F8O03_01415 [Pseudoclavibacter terrae]PPG33387.1 hypothetical protein C5B97_01880 [Pseudoclavibacter sp. RFBB5]PPG43310.1 hypothetical protein C5C17_01740 [Pseudoclavibacter sp. RFBA6]